MRCSSEALLLLLSGFKSQSSTVAVIVNGLFSLYLPNAYATPYVIWTASRCLVIAGLPSFMRLYCHIDGRKEVTIIECGAVCTHACMLGCECACLLKGLHREDAAWPSLSNSHAEVSRTGVRLREVSGKSMGLE